MLPSRRSAMLLRIPRFICWQRSISSSFGFAISGNRPCVARLTHLDSYRDHFNRCSRSTSSSRSKSTLTSQHGDFKSTRRSHRLANDDIIDGEIEPNNANSGGDDYSIDIEDNGKAISITTACKNIDHDVAYENDAADTSAMVTSSWKFSSALLWVNDPQHIHASSGQRLRTLGQYSKDSVIVSARVHYTNGDGESIGNSNRSLLNLHPLPPQGSMHSRGGIYCSKMVDSHHIAPPDHRRTLVELKWSYGEETIFDLDWLVAHARNNCLGRCMPDDLKDIANGTYSRNRDILDGSSRKGLEGRRVATITTTKVTKEIAIGAKQDSNGASIASFDYQEIIENEDVLFQGTQEIFEHGAVLVRNAPNVEDESGFDEMSQLTSLESVVGNLGKRFSGGNLSHGSLYGDIFHVKSKSDAENIAYTNVALPPHQDLAYYESKPFLQLLHCVTNTSDNIDDGRRGYERRKSDKPTNTDRIVGGESVLIDGMAAAEELRWVAPDLFYILCNTEATFLKERHDTDMVSAKPHIVVDPAYDQVVEINWSPPFEGPLQIQPRVTEDDYIRAYQAIECMLDDNVTGTGRCVGNSTFLPDSLETMLRNYAKEYTWEYALQKGDILVFNNQRMLHGRRSFSSIGNVNRHLIGCYTDSMDTVSRYRQLLRQRHGKGGGGYGKRNPGSGYRWI